MQNHGVAARKSNSDAIASSVDYRETVLPARGRLGAHRWYLRQVVSFVSIAALIRAAIGWVREGAMFDRLTRTPSIWVAAGVIALVALLGTLVRSNFGPAAAFTVFIAISVVLGGSAAMSTRRRADLQSLWRIGLVCGVLVAVVLLTRLLFEVFDPLDPVERFLAQARDDYSEFNYPRRWLPAVAVAAILMGGGLRAAWKPARVGMGTLTAIAASLTGSLVYVALVALGNALPFGPQDPVGSTPLAPPFFGSIPTMLIPVLVMLSTVLGTIGALFGRALAAGKTAQSHG
jgi:hypothetical protein